MAAAEVTFLSTSPDLEDKRSVAEHSCPETGAPVVESLSDIHLAHERVPALMRQTWRIMRDGGPKKQPSSEKENKFVTLSTKELWELCRILTLVGKWKPRRDEAWKDAVIRRWGSWFGLALKHAISDSNRVVWQSTLRHIVWRLKIENQVFFVYWKGIINWEAWDGNEEQA